MKRKRILKVLSLLLVIALFANSLTVSVSQAKSKVKLNKTKVTLTIGNSVGLKLKNTKSKPKWSSSNKSVVTVNSSGDIIAKSAGKAKITAKLAKKKYTCNVTVPRQYISATSITLHVGENREITIYGISFDDEIYWESSANDIVSISKDGVITGMNDGSAYIYGIINAGTGKTYKCNVTVIDDRISPTATIEPITPEPIQTPTPEPIVTPTPVPVITPVDTSRPMETAQPTTSPNMFSNAAYTKIAEYITTYGYRSDDSYGIATSTILSGSKYYYGVFFYPESKLYKFMFTSESKLSDVLIAMSIYPERLDNTKVEFLYATKDLIDSCGGITYIDISKCVLSESP